MAPKWHPTPLSGGDRKALEKELSKARAMTGILAQQSEELRARVERRNVVIDNIARIRSKETASGIEALKRKIALAYSF